jgi:hypothetical protein
MMDDNGEPMPLTIYEARDIEDDRGKFVAFWEAQYDFEQKDDELYKQNVGKPLTEELIMEWFKWKNGMSLSERKERSVRQNFVAHLVDLDTLPKDASASALLDRFTNGGVIWRIFWLHCWQPERFPIYDQHVHRAMRFIQEGLIEEIPTTDRRKIESYINNYLPFHAEFSELNSRSVDKALWAFGRFLSRNKVMLP